MRTLIGSLLLAAALSLPAFAGPRELNGYLSGGVSMQNWHGQARIGSAQLELVWDSKRVQRWISHTEIGTTAILSDVDQPREWDPYHFGAATNQVKAIGLELYARHLWRTGSNRAQPFLEIGSGPMWSMREVPATTSHINFQSQFALGAVFFPQSKTPLRIGWRFFHISNGVIAERNPGLNVNSIYIGTRLASFR